MGQDLSVPFRIALIGNPNSGKSSVFNQLTGLRQRTGNFPGVTVERHSGMLHLAGGTDVRIIDFPGTYSLYPTSPDEYIVFDVLSHPGHADHPDRVLYVADALRLDQHLLLLSQVRDLGIPAILALNMVDAASGAGQQFDVAALSRDLGLPVIEINGRTGAGMEALRHAMAVSLASPQEGDGSQPVTFERTPDMAATIRDIRERFPMVERDYTALLLAHHAERLSYLRPEEAAEIRGITKKNGFVSLQAQYTEIMSRFAVIDRITALHRKAVGGERSTPLTRRLDRFLTHVWWGPLVFFAILLLVFQAVFTWSSLPMTWIEGVFTDLGGMVRYALGEGWLSSLLSDGLLAGLGGVLVFIPQIAMLFLLISLLEESGYMARAVFLFDRIMRKFGLNGRSLVALVSGTACAIPAVMSARTITNTRERLITILVTPFISCSARLPVYAVLVGLMVPETYALGVFSVQALVFMGLYILGLLAALGAALVFKRTLKGSEPGFLLLELPDYQRPDWRNVGMTVWSKVASFVREAGKIILVISLVLWVMSSFGPPGAMDRAEKAALAEAQTNHWDAMRTGDHLAAARLEASYAGLTGKAIEPVIRPLGFDWKIGIALVTSFAAREVFVGTMATIYSIGSQNDEQTVRERMAAEIVPGTDRKRYDLPVSLSLLLFYVFALQCMSTLAVVRKETGSWKWPLWQFVFMTGLAYVVSLVTYQWLSA